LDFVLFGASKIIKKKAHGDFGDDWVRHQDHGIVAGLRRGINIVHNQWCFQEGRVHPRRQIEAGSACFQ
jgi:hypothetical protein